MSDTRASFGDELRRLRSEASFSQEELAERAGLSRRGISDLERGARHRPYLSTVGMLADALALGPDDRLALRAAARPERPLDLPQSAPGGLPLFPSPLTTLIGREWELAALVSLLGNRDQRLVTLTGAGGSGKTRLALEVGLRLQRAFADGAVFVDLAPLREAGLVTPTIADTLGVRGLPGQGLRDTLSRFLGPKQLLLIVDNFEQVLDAAADVAALLAASPHLSILVTSREPLRVRGERLVPLAPLPLPGDDHLPALEELAQVPAVALFVERAMAVDPGFMLAVENASAVTAICRRLDGLPLALELAAARVRILPPQAMLARLEHRLPFLTGGARDAPPRQRTMREAIAWSYDLLPPEEQRLFRRLAVFVGGFTVEAAEWVLDALPRVFSVTEPISPSSDTPSILDLLAGLINKSLLRPMPSSGVKGEPRFTMLETIREFALERLEQCDEGETIHAAHARHFAALAADIDAARTGLADRLIAEQIAAESGNLRGALAWFRSRDDLGGTLRMAASLWPLWLEHGAVTEGRGVLEECLARPNARDDLSAWARAAATLAMLAQAQGDHALVAKWSTAVLETDTAQDARIGGMALTARGLDAMVRGDYRQARNDLSDAGNRFRGVDDPRSGSWALRHLAGITFRTGEGDVLRLAQEGLVIAEEQGNALDVAKALHTLGTARAARGDVAGASRAWAESLCRFRENDDAWGVADALSSLGGAAFDSGNAAPALRLLVKALEGFRRVGDPEGTALTLGRMGWVMRDCGDLDAAEHHFDACLHLARSSNSPVQQVTCLYGHAATALSRRDTSAAAVALRDALSVPGVSKARPELANGVEWGAHLLAVLEQPTKSAQVLGAVTAFRGCLEVCSPRVLLRERASLVASLHSVLGEATFAIAYAEGQGMPIATATGAIFDEGPSP